ncbi:hypothetical protein GCM10009787_55210 [Streptomyces bangladeshensis]|uniref:Uncharacterized protein n=1 Tax=Streptomyces bangladeshensis TaxID=295352 RepID=A0ABN3BWW0_9ACTN
MQRFDQRRCKTCRVADALPVRFRPGPPGRRRVRQGGPGRSGESCQLPQLITDILGILAEMRETAAAAPTPVDRSVTTQIKALTE